MHVVEKKYEQVHTRGTTTVTTIIKIIQSAEAHTCNINGIFAKLLIIKHMRLSGIIIKRNALRVSKHVTESTRNIARGVGINYGDKVICSY